ncbi:MAG: choice-of-anchor L domain-containing protein, partial [Flavobacteriales bacterium]
MRKIALFVFSLFSSIVYSQVTVVTVTPAEAVAALVGPDVQVSNISFTGDAVQLGLYQNAGGNFPVPNGIILSTSHAG